MAHQGRVRRIAIGADHRGYELKEKLKRYLEEKGYEVEDLGTYSKASCDYPDFAIPVAEIVAKGEVDRGILICYTGIGMSIAANKVKGVRASLCFIPELAELTRKHNDSNVLVLGSMYITFELAKKIVDKWFSTDFEGGRHQRRIDKIKEYENSAFSSG